MKTNIYSPAPKITTHGGSVATPASAKQALRRTIMTAMLWEDSFYEDGKSIAKRIQEMVPTVDPQTVAVMAVSARKDMYLRHVPLLLVRELARYTSGNQKKSKNQSYQVEGQLIEETLNAIIQRPDEITEFLSIYWKDGKCPISASVKRGLAKAFAKFSEYSLAKYDREGNIKLRDVMFLTHPRPIDGRKGFTKKGRRKTSHIPLLRSHEELFRKVSQRELEVPDTWEVNLSAGADKKETFERLLKEKKLGGLATLRNLRNMVSSGVDEKLIRARLSEGCEKALPFRFISAAKYAPQLEDAIQTAMLSAVSHLDKMPGRTLIVVDRSGSMHANLSLKSEMNRLDAAQAMAILAKGIAEQAVVYATAGCDSSRKHSTRLIPSGRTGFALRDEIARVQIGGGGIFLAQCMQYIEQHESEKFDRVIVITDEQDCDIKLKPTDSPKLGRFNYLVNIGTEKNGISYQDDWYHIDGFSERVFDFIRLYETI